MEIMRLNEGHARLSRDQLGSAPGGVSYVRDVNSLRCIPEGERESLSRVSEKFSFRANDYYLGLIDWSDPYDPIRRIIVPHEDELCEWGELDASNEAANTVLPGVQHKYSDTALLLTVEACGGNCRYCFRKRLFMRDHNADSRNREAGLGLL